MTAANTPSSNILQISGLPPSSELLVLGTGLVLIGAIFLIQAQLVSSPTFSPRGAFIVTVAITLALGYYIQQSGIPDWYPPLIGAGLVLFMPLAICLNLLRELSVV